LEARSVAALSAGSAETAPAAATATNSKSDEIRRTFFTFFIPATL
jgi:hypothetical protein